MLVVDGRVGGAVRVDDAVVAVVAVAVVDVDAVADTVDVADAVADSVDTDADSVDSVDAAAAAAAAAAVAVPHSPTNSSINTENSTALSRNCTTPVRRRPSTAPPQTPILDVLLPVLNIHIRY